MAPEGAVLETPAEGVELGHERPDHDPRSRPRGGAVDLAVGAVEVADLVGVEVHADGQPPGASRHHRVDVAIPVEVAAVVGEGERPRHGTS
jgi:hypothetical protein